MHRRSLLALLLITSTCTSVFAADEETGIINRPAKEIVLQFDKDKSKTIHLASAPYIAAGVITLFPGDKILIEFQIVDSTPKNPKVVKENVHPERTLELKMKQDKDITIVQRNSGFAQKLTMDCYFLTVGSDFENHANMYPLEKGMGSFDSFAPKTYCVKFYDFGFAR